MEPTAPMSASPVPVPGHKSAALQVQARGLAAARRRATALLAGVTVLFVAVTAVGTHGVLLGYVQAGAEASMVGGVADWFAVTALFRHPLGLPIPHTALIVERKDQFAATLGRFVQENFLTADVLAERIHSAGLVPRLAAWLADEANAARFAGRAADLVVTVAETLRDEDVQRVLTAELTRAVDAVEVAPLAGRALRVIIAGGHHAEVFNAILSGADRYLAGHHAELRELFEDESPRWVPDAVYRRGFARPYNPPRPRPGGGGAGSPTAWRHPRNCASAASALSAMSWGAPACGTGPRRCGRRLRRGCGSRLLTRSLSCAVGWPMHWWRPDGA